MCWTFRRVKRLANTLKVIWTLSLSSSLNILNTFKYLEMWRIFSYLESAIKGCFYIWIPSRHRLHRLWPSPQAGLCLPVPKVHPDQTIIISISQRCIQHNHNFYFPKVHPDNRNFYFPKVHPENHNFYRQLHQYWLDLHRTDRTVLEELCRQIGYTPQLFEATDKKGQFKLGRNVL